MRPLAGLLALGIALPAWGGLLSPSGVFVKDGAGTVRSTYSNSERLTLSARINNAVASANRVQFVFRVTNPSGAEVFRHSGNSVPGSVGNSASQVSGLAIAKFFTGPGVYTFSADAALDGQTVSQSAQFTVSSPNIIMVYPPNGARDVSDKPLTFRWVSSGAAKYRLTVGDNAALYNSVFSQDTQGAESFLSYPENPADPRANLASGQVYYWRVEGLDPSGNVVARTELPFNFTARTASLTRDLAVASLETTGLVGTEVFFKVKVANQGGTSEANVSLRLSLGGLPASGSPVTLPQMSPGASGEYAFSAQIPTDQAQSLAIACLDFFDDSVANNCKSVQVQRPAGASSEAGFGAARQLTKEELWQAVKQKLIELGYDLSKYDLDSMSDLTAEEMASLLASLSSGQVQVSVTGPPAGAGPPVVFVPPATGGGSEEGSGAPPPLADLPADGAAPDDSEVAAELRRNLDEKLRSWGIDLREYDLDFGRPLTPEEQQALIDALEAGDFSAGFSGPPPGTERPSVRRGSAAAGGVQELPQFAEPPVFDEPAGSGGDEEGQAAPAVRARGFSGQTVENFGSRGHTSVVRDQKAWARLWRRLAGTKAPEVDFAADMVVVVVAGTKKAAARVEFERVAEETEGLKVVYRASGRSALKGTAPFAAVVVRTTDRKAEFKDAEEGR